MDLSAFVCKLLEEQDGDVLREGIRVLSQALLDTEVAGLIGANHHERTPETGHCNGYRMRTGDGVSDARSRPTDYPYLWVDAMYRKVRVHGRVPAKRRSSRRGHQRWRAPGAGQRRRAVRPSGVLDRLSPQPGEA
jgi:transposase-like protein